VRIHIFFLYIQPKIGYKYATRYPTVSYQIPISSHHPPLITHHLPFTVYLCTFSCKTNPISKIPEMNLTVVATMGYKNMPPSAARKTNPKRTQTNPNKANPTPIFRLLRPPKAKTNPNEPKQTQPVVSLSNLSITARPPCRGQALCEARQALRMILDTKAPELLCSVPAATRLALRHTDGFMT
jgi:hypothetical protein